LSAFDGQAALKIHPLMPVSRASYLLGENQKVLESLLESGEIRGVKRTVNEKKNGEYCWFIYACDFETLLERHVETSERRLNRFAHRSKSATKTDTEIHQSNIAIDGLEDFFGPAKHLESTTLSQLDSQLASASQEPETITTGVVHIDSCRAQDPNQDPTTVYQVVEADTVGDTSFSLAAQLWQKLQNADRENEQVNREIKELRSEIESLRSEMELLRLKLLVAPNSTAARADLTESKKENSMTGFLKSVKRFFLGQ
jgi:predicted RNase H-like nuclease (RuvC/YqgF family)